MSFVFNFKEVCIGIAKSLIRNMIVVGKVRLVHRKSLNFTERREEK